MLTQLIYISRNEHVSEEDVDNILSTANKKNNELGITGILFFREGTFIQLLEGSREHVNAIYNTIINDKRHYDVCLVRYAYPSKRVCPDWSMAYLPEISPSQRVALKYSESSQVNFYDMSEESILGYITDMAKFVSDY